MRAELLGLGGGGGELMVELLVLGGGEGITHYLKRDEGATGVLVKPLKKETLRTYFTNF